MTSMQTPEADGALRALVNIINSSSPEARLGVTLSVKGVLISGLMAPRDTWLEQQSASRGDDDPLAGLWNDLKLDRLPKDQEDGGPIEWFVHLLEGRYLQALGSYPGRSAPGMPIRVRVSEVDSWAPWVFGHEDETQEDGTSTSHQ